MNNREKVIKALETDMMNFSPACTSDEHLKETMKMALELLKERETRVIDISEIYTAKKLDVWIEQKSENIVYPLMLIDTLMTDKSQAVFFYPMVARPIKAYGKTWRCWTARPTDAQRKAVKWDA